MSEYTADMIELLTAEPETEQHIVIAKDKTVIVPDELKEINTQFEHNIETVTFDCPRYWDEHDLSTMHIYVNVRRPDKKEIPSLCSAPVVDAADATVIHFDWTLSKDVTHVKGTLDFVAVAKKADENGILQNRWGSRLNRDMEILEGIECETDEIVEESADIIEQILYRLETAAATASASAATAERAEKSAIAAAERANSVAASNPNLLDNWYFADPVNQRGKTEYTDGYAIDRWRIIAQSSPKLTLEEDGLLLESDAQYGIILQQTIDPELVKRLAGYTICLSVIGENMSGGWHVQVYINNHWTASAVITSGCKNVVFNVPADANSMLISITNTNAAAAKVKIKAVKLELGSVQTLAHQDANGNWVLNDPPPDKGMELMKCQRYQVPLWGNIDTYRALGFARTSDTSKKTAEMIVPIPVTLRANPTLVTGSAVFQMYASETDYAGVTSIAFSDIAPGFVRLLIVAEKELTGGSMYVLRKTTDDLVLLDANL